METCGNCGRPIGNLEIPAVFKGSIVCAECHKKLCDQLRDLNFDSFDPPPVESSEPAVKPVLEYRPQKDDRPKKYPSRESVHFGDGPRRSFDRQNNDGAKFLIRVVVAGLLIWMILWIMQNH